MSRGLGERIGVGDRYDGRARRGAILFGGGNSRGGGDGGGGGLSLRGDWLVIGRRPHIIDPNDRGRNRDDILLEPNWREIVEQYALRVDQEELFRDAYKNLVVDQGVNHALDIELSGGTQITSWFLALLQGTPTIAASSTYQNLMSTGNEEFTTYSEGTRQAWSDGGVSAKSVDNSGSPATFTISSDGQTIGGAALVSSNTKNDNAAGPFMYAAGAFSAGDKSLDTNDTVDVTATFTGDDDGA